MDKTIAFQIRSLRNKKGWTQAKFAKELGISHPNNVSARLENPDYGKHTLTTLKKIAATCDVGLVVWFVPFSRLADWESGTPYIDQGLSPAFYEISPFDEDEELEHHREELFEIDSDAFGSESTPIPKTDDHVMERPNV